MNYLKMRNRLGVDPQLIPWLSMFSTPLARAALASAAPAAQSRSNVLMFGQKAPAHFKLNEAELMARTTVRPNGPDILAMPGELSGQVLGNHVIPTLAQTAGGQQFANDRTLATVDSRIGPVPASEMAAKLMDQETASGKAHAHQAQPGFGKRHRLEDVPPMAPITPSPMA